MSLLPSSVLEIRNHWLGSLQSKRLQFSGDGFRISGRTHWLGSLSLIGYGSWATDFESRDALIGLKVTVWEATVLAVRISNLQTHSLACESTVWEATVLMLQISHLGTHSSASEYTVSGYGFRISGRTHSLGSVQSGRL